VHRITLDFGVQSGVAEMLDADSGRCGFAA
jgi:hypothetical protein